jgi:HEAT repeat protein
LGFFDKLFGSSGTTKKRPAARRAAQATISDLRESRNAAALLKALGNPDAERRRDAADALREMPDAVAAVPGFVGYKKLEAAAQSDTDPEVRDKAARALIALILDGVAKGGGAEKVSNIGLLASWPHPDTTEAVLGLLSDPSADVRAAALDVLKAHGVLAGVDERMSALLKDDDWIVRAAACRALGGRHEAAEHLVPLLEDEHELVRAAAAVALGASRDERARERLIELAGQAKWDKLSGAGRTAFDLLARTATQTLARTISGTPDDPRAIALTLLRGMPPASLAAAVDELAALYAPTPDGFVRSGGDPAVDRIREIGAWLDSQGGKPTMLEAHAEFAGRMSPGAARNLEMLWDGIGTWRG